MSRPAGAQALPAGAVPADVRAGASIEVRPVRGRAERRRFLHFPWRVNAGDPLWVPPLLADQKKLFDRSRHPFHQHADVEYFLAWRGREVVGRIAAIINHRYNEFHGEQTGTFGFFDVEDDPAAAAALREAAEQWLAARGMDRVLGPFNFSTNDESTSPGVLIDGFETPPALMMSHNPRYYSRLIEWAGYGKAKDLLAYWLQGDEPPDRLVRGVARIQRQEQVVLRGLDLAHFPQEVERIKEVYNSAWERNWGFVPMTDAEMDHLAHELKPVVNPALCVIAEIRGEPVAFALALPDLNQALRHVNGRLFPFGLVKLLWHARRIRTARVLTLGIKPGYRRLGLDAMMYLRIWTEGHRLGFRAAECSWILEDNWDMRRGLERMGALVYKTYRVYEKPLRS